MILNGVSMLSSDIGPAHCDTARYWQQSIPTDDDRKAAPRALRGRSRPTTRPGRNFQAGWRSETEGSGAGEGNRTLVISLEGFCSTIELHPRVKRALYATRTLYNASKSTVSAKVGNVGVTTRLPTRLRAEIPIAIGAPVICPIISVGVVAIHVAARIGLGLPIRPLP